MAQPPPSRTRERRGRVLVFEGLEARAVAAPCSLIEFLTSLAAQVFHTSTPFSTRRLTVPSTPNF